MLTFGIAGHVDHGKTSLVRALTGIETDRLPEERRRGISIELGFAFFDAPLPQGGVERVGIVDMPGHERFVRRMIAGAAGIDAVLLVVAADEGAMPQGREHLSICRLLGLRHGAVVLTKTDLVDADMIELARDDAAELVAGTFLGSAPVFACSVRQDESIEALRRDLGGFVQRLRDGEATRLDGLRSRPFRLAVDRSFTVAGRGTVVAGTQATGQLRAEDQVEVLPQGAIWRVRGLERHGALVDLAEAPGRLAVNLAAAAVADVPVGAVLARPGSLTVTDRFDARLSLLPHAEAALPVRKRATVHLGTTQIEATLVQLSNQPQAPGTEAYVQVRLDARTAVAADEGFVVRGSHADARHGQTFAGGRVLHPAPRRHRLGDESVLAALEAIASAGPEAALGALVGLAGVRGMADAETERASALAPVQVHKVAKALLATGRLRRVGSPPRWYSPAAFAELEGKVIDAATRFHAQFAARPGPEPDSLHPAVGAWLDASATSALVQGLLRRGTLVARGSAVALPGFEPTATARPELVDALVRRLDAQGLAVESPVELSIGLAADVRDVLAALAAATADGRLLRVAQDMHVATARARSAADSVIAAFAARDNFATGELKDLLGLTRKHLIPFAEWLDQAKITVRDPAGNRRIRERALQAWRERQVP